MDILNPISTALPPDELTLLDLAQWEDAAAMGADDIGFSTSELGDICGTFGGIISDPDYADLYAAEGITDPPAPRIRIDFDKLRRLRDRIRRLQGRLWDRLKQAHKVAVQRIIDSLLETHPLP